MNEQFKSVTLTALPARRLPELPPAAVVLTDVPSLDELLVDRAMSLSLFGEWTCFVPNPPRQEGDFA